MVRLLILFVFILNFYNFAAENLFLLFKDPAKKDVKQLYMFNVNNTYTASNDFADKKWNKLDENFFGISADLGGTKLYMFKKENVDIPVPGPKDDPAKLGWKKDPNLAIDRIVKNTCVLNIKKNGYYHSTTSGWDKELQEKWTAFSHHPEHHSFPRYNCKNYSSYWVAGKIGWKHGDQGIKFAPYTNCYNLDKIPYWSGKAGVGPKKVKARLKDVPTLSYKDIISGFDLTKYPKSGTFSQTKMAKIIAGLEKNIHCVSYDAGKTWSPTECYLKKSKGCWNKLLFKVKIKSGQWYDSNEWLYAKRNFSKKHHMPQEIVAHAFTLYKYPFDIKKHELNPSKTPTNIDAPPESGSAFQAFYYYLKYSEYAECLDPCMPSQSSGFETPFVPHVALTVDVDGRKWMITAKPSGDSIVTVDGKPATNKDATAYYFVPQSITTVKDIKKLSMSKGIPTPKVTMIGIATAFTKQYDPKTDTYSVGNIVYISDSANISVSKTFTGEGGIIYILDQEAGLIKRIAKDKIVTIQADDVGGAFPGTKGGNVGKLFDVSSDGKANVFIAKLVARQVVKKSAKTYEQPVFLEIWKLPGIYAAKGEPKWQLFFYKKLGSIKIYYNGKSGTNPLKFNKAASSIAPINPVAGKEVIPLSSVIPSQIVSDFKFPNEFTDGVDIETVPDVGIPPWEKGPDQISGTKKLTVKSILSSVGLSSEWDANPVYQGDYYIVNKKSGEIASTYSAHTLLVKTPYVLKIENPPVNNETYYNMNENIYKDVSDVDSDGIKGGFDNGALFNNNFKVFVVMQKVEQKDNKGKINVYWSKKFTGKKTDKVEIKFPSTGRYRVLMYITYQYNDWKEIQDDLAKKGLGVVLKKWYTNKYKKIAHQSRVEYFNIKSTAVSDDNLVYDINMPSKQYLNEATPSSNGYSFSDAPYIEFKVKMVRVGKTAGGKIKYYPGVGKFWYGKGAPKPPNMLNPNVRNDGSKSTKTGQFTSKGQCGTYVYTNIDWPITVGGVKEGNEKHSASEYNDFKIRDKDLEFIKIKWVLLPSYNGEDSIIKKLGYTDNLELKPINSFTFSLKDAKNAGCLSMSQVSTGVYNVKVKLFAKRNGKWVPYPFVVPGTYFLAAVITYPRLKWVKGKNLITGKTTTAFYNLMDDGVGVKSTYDAKINKVCKVVIRDKTKPVVVKDEKIFEDVATTDDLYPGKIQWIVIDNNPLDDKLATNLKDFSIKGAGLDKIVKFDKNEDLGVATISGNMADFLTSGVISTTASKKLEDFKVSIKNAVQEADKKKDYIVRVVKLYYDGYTSSNKFRVPNKVDDVKATLNIYKDKQGNELLDKERDIKITVKDNDPPSLKVTMFDVRSLKNNKISVTLTSKEKTKPSGTPVQAEIESLDMENNKVNLDFESLKKELTYSIPNIEKTFYSSVKLLNYTKKQTPTEVTVDLGKPSDKANPLFSGKYVYIPEKIRVSFTFDDVVDNIALDKNSVKVIDPNGLIMEISSREVTSKPYKAVYWFKAVATGETTLTIKAADVTGNTLKIKLPIKVVPITSLDNQFSIERRLKY